MTDQSKPEQPNAHVDAQAEARRVLKLLMWVVLSAEPRGADIAVVEMMAKDQSVDEARLIAATYIWDHLMGEPEEIGPEDLVKAYVTAKEILES